MMLGLTRNRVLSSRSGLPPPRRLTPSIGQRWTRDIRGGPEVSHANNTIVGVVVVVVGGVVAVVVVVVIVYVVSKRIVGRCSPG